jgi:hypothetical protein
MASMSTSSSPDNTDGRTLDPNGTAHAPRFTGRRIGTPRALPGGRALLGGLLIGVAMVAAVALSRSVAAPDTVPVVVAATAIRPGESTRPPQPPRPRARTPRRPRRGAPTPTQPHCTARSPAPTSSPTRCSSGAASSKRPPRSAPLHRPVRSPADRRRPGGRGTPRSRRPRRRVLATYGNGLDALTFVVLADAPGAVGRPVRRWRHQRPEHRAHPRPRASTDTVGWRTPSTTPTSPWCAPRHRESRADQIQDQPFRPTIATTRGSDAPEAPVSERYVVLGLARPRARGSARSPGGPPPLRCRSSS